MGEILAVVIVIALLVYAWKQITGGVAIALFIFVSLYSAYFLMGNVFYTDIPLNIKTPSRFKEIDEYVGEVNKDRNHYEYGEIEQDTPPPQIEAKSSIGGTYDSTIEYRPIEQDNLSIRERYNNKVSTNPKSNKPKGSNNTKQPKSTSKKPKDTTKTLEILIDWNN